MFGSSVCNTLILTTMKSEFVGEKNCEKYNWIPYFLPLS